MVFIFLGKGSASESLALKANPPGQVRPFFFFGCILFLEPFLS